MTWILADNPLYLATGVIYAGAMGLYGAAWRSSKAIVGRAATGLLVAALACNAALIAQRWIEADRAPFKSLYESLVFLAFCVAAVYLAMEALYRTRAFGALAAAGSLGALAYGLVKWDAEIVKLPPALQSGWFVPHVVVYFVGYAALFFAALVSAVQLVWPTFRPRAGTALAGEASLEDIAYDAVKLGFTLLTVGLFVGSVWAKSAWGDWWVWDPKENWSLVTWLVFGGYLHLRRLKGWRGAPAAWLTIAGFAAVMFTYLGMNMLPTAEESAHVYTE